jgi:hypothetical protein
LWLTAPVAATALDLVPAALFPGDITPAPAAIAARRTRARTAKKES